MRASNLRRLRLGEEKKIERKKEETTGQNIILTVGHKKSLKLYQKSTDFNAVFTVRFRNERHMR